MLPVIKNLKEEMEKIAEKELGETKLIRKESLEKLKQLLKEVPDLNPLLEDDFLIKFLRVRKFNVQRALSTIIKYYATKKMYSKVYTEVLPSEMEMTLEKNALYVLTKKPTFGPSVYWSRFAHLDSEKCTIDHLMALTLITSEIDLRQESAQIYGAHAILDLKGCGLLQLGQLASIKRIKIFASYIQESWPGRVKGLHVINEPLCVHYLCHFLRSLLSEKLRERFHVYGDDIKSLQKHISPDVLPAELGGTAEPINDCEYKSFILSQESYLEKLNQYGFRNNLVIDKAL